MRQAGLLGEVELTLQAIEAWQQIDLDLQPLDDPLPHQTVHNDLASTSFYSSLEPASEPPEFGVSKECKSKHGASKAVVFEEVVLETALCEDISSAERFSDYSMFEDASPTGATLDDNSSSVAIKPASTINLSMTPAHSPDAIMVKVCFPISALGKLKPVAEDLSKAFAIQWDHLHAALFVDGLTLSANELAAIEHGGLVLLPRSFDTQWRAELRLLGSRDFVVSGIYHVDAAQLDAAQLKLSVHEPAATAVPGKASADPVFFVRLCQLVSLMPESVMGNPADSVLPLGLPSAGIEAELIKGNQTLAKGAIGPIGAGHAFFIDELPSQSQAITA